MTTPFSGQQEEGNERLVFAALRIIEKEIEEIKARLDESERDDGVGSRTAVAFRFGFRVLTNVYESIKGLTFNEEHHQWEKILKEK